MALTPLVIEFKVDSPWMGISIPEVFCLSSRIGIMRLDLGMGVIATGPSKAASGASLSVLPFFRESFVSCLDTSLLSDGLLLDPTT